LAPEEPQGEASREKRVDTFLLWFRHRLDHIWHLTFGGNKYQMLEVLKQQVKGIIVLPDVI